MTKTKSTKRALLGSVLALLVCVSMLIGSTFAWFTDSVTSSGNIIKSGTLDVTMEWADGTKAVPADDSSDWTDASKGAIFKSELWEPGYTEVRHIKIANEGTLALKYQLNIIANGEVSKLADVIDVYYVDPAVQVADRTELTDANKLGTLTEVLANISTTASGNLKATEKHTITLALKMQESAGNEYQDLAIGSDFSIQLLATQLTSEFDSFDDQYDKDATYGSYIELEAGADLLAALKSAEADLPVTIKLNGNVEWPTEGHLGENDITPASSIVIDGNGYTITATGSGVTPLGDVEAPMTLKNVKIVDNSVSYAESAWEFTYLEMGGTKLNCENVTFADEIQFGTNATFTNCTFESNEESVYAVWVEDGSATFTNCIFTGCRGLKTHEAYGSEVAAVVIDNCIFKNITKKPGIALGTLNADTTVSITNSKFIGCQAGDNNLYMYETDTDVNTIKFTNEGNEVLGLSKDNAELSDALKNAQAGDTIYVAEGTYTFPTSSFKAGTTLICEEGTVFNGKTSFGINGATVVGATFTNNNAYVCNSTTINGTFKDCVFTNCDGLRYCYAGETVVFENCVFDTDFYGVHFDGGANDVIFKNCTFTGFNTFGSAVTKLTLEGCTFKYNGKGGYNGINMWGTTDLINCTFVFDGSASNEWVDACGDNKTIYAKGCVVSNGTTERALALNDIGDYGTGNTITVE
jgi:predicted ribosomally synthesized peptide with SipW-like signal peptide